MAQANSKTTKPPVIAVPSSADEKVRLGKVALIATVGLAAGLIWPRLVGMQLTPTPPSEGSSSAPTSSARASDSAKVAVEPPTAAPEPAASASNEAQPPVKPPKVTLAQVVNCRDKDGTRETRCDTPALDAVVQSPLQSLIACDAAAGVQGLLSIGFDADFEANRLDHFTVGKSTTLSGSTAKQLVRCAEKELGRISLEGVTHGKTSYRIFYKVDFSDSSGGPTGTSTLIPSSGPTASTPELIAASGRVTVTWDSALVRGKPKDGEILARVLGGTRLTVTGRQGDWYRVKYDAKGSEGWVYKSAIGL